jgi:WD40 repeat protein
MEKQFNIKFAQFEISLINKINMINIKIYDINSNNEYESNFNDTTFNFFFPNIQLDEIINEIYNLIKDKKIEIQKKKIDLKLILISEIQKINNLELFIYKKFQKIISIKVHENNINSVSTFPNGNIISVSADKSIKIYDKINYTIIQNIIDAHQDRIVYVDIIDDNNFITCSSDKSIKTWNKNNQNIFYNNKSILNAHEDIITKLLHYQTNKIISCSWDHYIKIWEEKDNNYIMKNTFKDENVICCILLLYDKNYLISGGEDGIKFWNLINFKVIVSFKNTFCGCWNSLSIINEDYILTDGQNDIKIISISQKAIIKNIFLNFDIISSIYIKDRKIILIGNEDKIIIMGADNFEIIQTYNNYLNNKGMIQLNDGSIATFGNDKTIKIWN